MTLREAKRRLESGGTGLIVEDGMLFSELAMELVAETGRLEDVAVEKLRSWVGSW